MWALLAAFAATALASEPAGFTKAGSSQIRVVTLAPSLTEIAYAIGCGPNLVADTSFDDYPAAARALPHVADLVTVDLERLTELAPTTVVALHDQEHEGAPIVSRLHLPVVYLPNRDLSDLSADIDGVGAACGKQASAKWLATRLRNRVQTLAQEAARLPDRPKVFFLLGLPGFTAGEHSFVGDLIGLAGGKNVAGTIAQPYPNVSSEWLLAADPDVIIVARDVQLGANILAQDPWRSMRAVKSGNIARPPSDDILERNGPRVTEGLAWLISAIHRH